MVIETLSNGGGGDWEPKNGFDQGGVVAGSGAAGLKPQVPDLQAGGAARSTGANRRARPWMTNKFSDVQPVENRPRRDLTIAAQFKTSPLVQAMYNSVRPYPARCCNCMPESKNSVFSLARTQAGIRNILEVPTKYGDNPWLCKRFFHLSFVMQRFLPEYYTNVTNAVLSSQRLSDAIEKILAEEIGENKMSEKEKSKIREREKKKAQQIVNRMSARISNVLVRFTGWFLFKLLNFLLDSIVIHKGQIQQIKMLSKRRMPLIFLPTHRSHLDYILMTFTVFNYDIRAPHVAAGDNLLIPFFGSLMRGLGGFFIRRKLDKVAGQKDHLYRAVLHTYMEELLRNDEYMEFFIEGGRTRSGKSIYPKGGLLSVLVDAYKNGVIPDAYLIPVSISYDKLVDGNFVREQMGEPKANETFWRAVVGIYKVFIGNFGSVRLDFSQPFSLREFLMVSKVYPKPDGGRGLDTTEGQMTDSCVSQLRGSSSSYAMDLISSTSDVRGAVQSLAEHVVYVSTSCQSIMSTHILSAALLTCHRQGAEMSEVCSTFDFIKSEILQRDHDLGFSGDTGDVVRYAAGLLGEQLVRWEQGHLVPTTSLPRVFELSYYANVVASVFATESMVANSIYCMVDRAVWNNQSSSVRVTMKQVLTEASELCDIFKYEFLLVPGMMSETSLDHQNKLIRQVIHSLQESSHAAEKKRSENYAKDKNPKEQSGEKRLIIKAINPIIPCQTTEQVVLSAFDKFRNTDILVPVEDKIEENGVTTEDKLWTKRFADSLRDDDDDWTETDITYEVNRSEVTWRKFWFIKRILSPIIDTYLVSAGYLTQLLDCDMSESDFIAVVHKTLKERVASGYTLYGESAALDTVRLSVKGFEQVKVLSRYQSDAGLTMISLTEQYQDLSNVNAFIQRIESLRD